MSRCACVGATCQCVLLDSATIDFSGAGSAAVPYTGTIKPTGVAPLLISTDVGNGLVIGGDGLLKTGGGGPTALFVSAAHVDAVAPGPFTTYASFVVAANTLATNNDRLIIRASFLFDAALADFNGFVFSFGGIPFASRVPTMAMTWPGYCTYELIRTGALTAKCVGSLWLDDNGAGNPIIETTVGSIATNFAIPQTFLLRLETLSGLGSELSGESLTVEFAPAP